MVRIWLPADTRHLLLEALPGWSRAHKLLDDATEVDYAVGVRQIACGLPDAVALLAVAERVCPESAPLIRLAIRKARTPARPGRYSLPPLQPEVARPARERRPRLAPLRQLATLPLLVFSFQVLQLVDRARELLRRVL